MQKLLAKTDSLIDKARKLKEQNYKLRTWAGELENEVKNLKQLLEAEVHKNAELNNKIKIIKLAQNIGSGKPDDPSNGGTEITELKRKINEYIREIDNCITILND